MKAAPLSVSALFTALVFVSLPAFAQSKSDSLESFTTGAVKGAVDILEHQIPAEVSAYLELAETTYPGRTPAFYEGFVAGAQCSQDVITSLYRQSELVVDDAANEKIVSMEKAQSLFVMLAHSGAASCQKSFIARLQLN